MARESLDSTTHVVSHLLREIESAIRDVLESHGKSAALGSNDDRHKFEIQSILHALDIPNTDPIAQAWLKLAGRKNDYGLQTRAHRDALSSPRPMDSEFRGFWEDIQRVLDAVLEKFEERYLLFHNRIDQLLSKEVPTREDARTLRNQIPNSLVALAYFFGKAPLAWLNPLRDEGFFRSPPQPDPVAGIPPWPESRYLARIAEQDPKIVLDIFLGLPETENVLVHLDLAEAALKMPPVLAAKLVPKAKSSIGPRHYPLLPERLGALIAHLAKGGQIDPALDLARELLAITPIEAETTSLGDGARSHLRDWDYQQILERHIPSLVQAAGERAIQLLADLLDTAISISNRGTGDRRPRDFSHIWRSTVEEDSPRQARDVRDALVSAIRVSAEQIASADPTKVSQLVGLLEERNWRIFHRITLFILSRFPEAAPELVAERLTDYERFTDLDLRHEYSLLARSWFGRLEPEEQGTILGWIEQGPDVEEYERVVEERTGELPTEEQAEQYAKIWRRDHLALLGENLPEDWKQRYAELVAQLGLPEHPDRPFFMSAVWTAPDAVIPADQANSMTVVDVVSFLVSWTTSGSFMAPTEEDLGRQVSSMVAARPKVFAAEAWRFRGLDPAYVGGFIRGLREASKQGGQFDWSPVMEVCLWAVHQSDTTEVTEVAHRHRKPWQWVHEIAVDLISHELGSGASEIPFALRGRVWEILRPLTSSRDPEPEDEMPEGSSPPDPLSLSINTVRGEAMHAVVRYALWVRRHSASEGKARVDRSFDDMPEVREVLEWHLNPSHDPSFAIRSVYGQYFPWLVLLDPSWTTTQVGAIFPVAESHRRLRDAAWKAYITMCPPDDASLALLHDEYVKAVESLGATPTESSASDKWEERLAEHLVAFYWRGKLRLADENGLLARFYLRAPDLLRGHALGFAGRSAANTEGPIAPVILERLRAFWAHRVDAACQAPVAGQFITEMAAFGWWVASKKFEDSWTLHQLREALSIAGQVEVDHLVVERLAELAVRMPTLAVECLSLMVDGDKEGWHIDLWKEHVRPVLVSALNSGDSEARDFAVALVNRLAARGHLGFSDLLT